MRFAIVLAGVLAWPPFARAADGIPVAASSRATVSFAAIAQPASGGVAPPPPPASFADPDPSAPGSSFPSPGPRASFAGLGDNNTLIPPDVQGAVGPNHIMVVLNTGILIQSRSGAFISEASPGAFWGPTG